MIADPHRKNLSQQRTSFAWLEALKTADSFAIEWEELLNCYGPFVKRILLRSGLQSASADDVTQHVMTVVWKKVPEFEHRDRGSFRAWLREITRNCLRDHLKSAHYRRRAVGGDDMTRQIPDQWKGLSATWDREYITYLLNELLDAMEIEFSRKTIEAFRRLAIHELPVDQVAAELGMTTNACFIARSRVTKRIKEKASSLVDSELLFASFN